MALGCGSGVRSWPSWMAGNASSGARRSSMAASPQRTKGRSRREDQERKRYEVDGGADGQGLPLGSALASASPAEVRLAEQTLQAIAVPRQGPERPRQKPERVLGDKAFDSDPLRARLAARGIELIAPHRENRTKPPTQDGRALHRYRWLGHFRRLVVRYERWLTTYRAFFHVACAMIILRHL